MGGFKKFEEQIEKDIPNTVNFLKTLFGYQNKKEENISPQTIEARPVPKTLQYEVKKLENSNFKCKACKDTLKINNSGRIITCPYCRGLK